MMDRRKILWALLTLLIGGLTVAAVFAQSESLSVAEVAAALRHASPFWLCLTLLSMSGFIVFEGLALLCLLRGLGYRQGFFHGLLYSAGDQYFSAITPSASGGQPASAFFMRRHRIPGAVITVTLLINLILYTMAILSIGVACLVLRPAVFLRFGPWSKALILFGMAALTALALLFCGLLKQGAVLFRLGRWLFLFLGRVHLVRSPDRWIGRLAHMVREYGMCARAIAGKKRVLIQVYLLDLAQRVAQISVTLLLSRALGGMSGISGADLWVIQAFSQIGSNCVPIPGGMGAADYLMLDGFRTLLQGDCAYQLQIVSRGISFYLCTLLSGLIVLIGYLVGRSGRQKRGD